MRSTNPFLRLLEAHITCLPKANTFLHSIPDKPNTPFSLHDTNHMMHRTRKLTISLATLTLLASCLGDRRDDFTPAILKRTPRVHPSLLTFPGESHISHVQQLTFTQDALHAQVSQAGDQILMTSVPLGYTCPQVFLIDTDGYNLRMWTRGYGSSTHAAFGATMPRIYFSSTKTCNAPSSSIASFPAHTIFLDPNTELFVSSHDGAYISSWAQGDGFDGELATSPQGNRLTWTSSRSKDPEIFWAHADGSHAKALTRHLGYDGQPSFAPDGNAIVFIQSHPKQDKSSIEEYIAQRDAGAIHTAQSSIAILTDLEKETPTLHTLTTHKTHYAHPVFSPTGAHIIFSSSQDDPKALDTDLFMMRRDGSHIERLTYNIGADSSPSFTRDGTRIVFTSTRNTTRLGERHVFIADWSPQAKPTPSTPLTGQAIIDEHTLRLRADTLLDASKTQTQTSSYIKRHFTMAHMIPLHNASFHIPLTSTPQRTNPKATTHATPSEQPAPPSLNFIGRLAARKDGTQTPQTILLTAHDQHTSKKKPNQGNAYATAAILEVVEALANAPRQHDIIVAILDKNTNSEQALKATLLKHNANVVLRLHVGPLGVGKRIHTSGLFEVIGLTTIARHAQAHTQIDFLAHSAPAPDMSHTHNTKGALITMHASGPAWPTTNVYAEVTKTATFLWHILRWLLAPEHTWRTRHPQGQHITAP